MNLSVLQTWTDAEAIEHFLRCCGSKRWATLMAKARPFASEEALRERVRQSFLQLAEEDWLEAFAAHPKIGGTSAPDKKFSSTQSWSAAEQSSMADAAESLLVELVQANQRYEDKNGFIYIVCATGKSPREMLTLLQTRLHNDRSAELAIAAEEQQKITFLRLEKLLK